MTEKWAYHELGVMALEEQHLMERFRLLSRDDISIDVKTTFGGTPLFAACEKEVAAGHMHGYGMGSGCEPRAWLRHGQRLRAACLAAAWAAAVARAVPMAWAATCALAA